MSLSLLAGRSFRARLLPLVLALAAVPVAGQTCDGVAPYGFLLFDTSGSMNVAPPCSQAQFDAGACSPLCPTGDCYLAAHGDDPGSKLYQAKAALYGAVSAPSNVLL